MSEFAKLHLAAPLLKALEEAGYTQPTPIQTQAIPHVLKGLDLFGIAQTGTGKTAAFALPILDRLSQHRTKPLPKHVRVLVLTPTRELASQILDSFGAYGKYLPLTRTVVFGGVGQYPQVKALSRGVDILVATPGRLLDLLEQRCLSLDHVEIFVLDEADRMLDMGFIVPIRRVVSMLPGKRQTLLFSATMPKPIAELAEEMLREPLRIEITPPATTVERIDQRVFMVERQHKRELLTLVLKHDTVHRTLIFTRTKRGADRLVEDLAKAGISSAAIHGNKSQGQREKALSDFKGGRLKTLVATDIAARGIDVPGVSHVINYELPEEPESYVHRIGRTARAGKDGQAISLCDATERSYLRDIERLIGREILVDAKQPYHSTAHDQPRPKRQQGGGGGGGGQRSGGGGRPSAGGQHRHSGQGRRKFSR